jgi:hypothetical protein
MESLTNSFRSYPWPPGVLPPQGLGSQRCWVGRVPCLRAQTFSTHASVHINTRARVTDNLPRRSREWVCPRCQQTNLESLPDPPQHAASTLNEPAGLRGLSRVQDQSEPPVRRPSRTPPSTAPERSSDPEATSDSDPTAISTLVTGSGPSIAGERDRIASRTEAVRGSPLVIRYRSHRSPLLLDTAICVLLVLVVALLCRRVL